MYCFIYNSAIGDEKVNLRENYVAHQTRKDEACTHQNSDKDRAKNDPKFISISYDLEKVWITPKSGTNALPRGMLAKQSRISIQISTKLEPYCD